MDEISITLEFTPNPNTLKFVVNRPLVEKGAANFTDAAKTEKAPLAKKLFQIPGVQGVLLGTHFVTVTKAITGDWDVIAEQTPLVIENHLKSGEPVIDQSFFEELAQAQSSSGGEIERKIREVLDNEIRPAVAMDGGDITFGRFEDGVVYLHLQGACSSCPSSVATLKMGVETRLKEVIPEVREVVQV